MAEKLGDISVIQRTVSDEYVSSKRQKTIYDCIVKGVTYVVLSAIGITMLIPLLWMVSTSLKEPGAVFTFPPQWIPKPIVWKNYLGAWYAVPFARFYLNSIIVGVAVTAGQVFTSALAAYAFARLRFPGRDKLFFGYLATMMIPEIGRAHV